MQLAVLFPCLVFSLAFLQGNASAQATCNGGQIQCANNTQCDTSGNCQCLPGFNGNGRVHCAPFRCVCAAFADPRFTIFDTPPAQLMLKVNLPCSVDLVVPAPLMSITLINGVNLCVISYITAHPEVRPFDSGPPFRTFVGEVVLSATTISPVVAVTAVVRRVGSSITPAGSGTLVAGADGFTRANLNTCFGLEIGYRGTYGEAYVALPENMTNANLAGLCGNCDGMSTEPVGITMQANLNYFLANLAPAARQSGPFQGQCANISQEVSTNCNTTERLNAARTCGLLLGPYGRCLLNNATSPITNQAALMGALQTCFTRACNGVPTATLCTDIGALATPTCPLPACPLPAP